MNDRQGSEEVEVAVIKSQLSGISAEVKELKDETRRDLRELKAMIGSLSFVSTAQY
jgi:hypothetical protein